jgi:hypothetical protein
VRLLEDNGKYKNIGQQRYIYNESGMTVVPL